MATFLGPSNMPLIEAAHLKCPVLCSDFAGHREILGDNALYFSPTDSNAIKNAMSRILDKQLRNSLSESAHNYIQQSHFTVDNALKILNDILKELIPIRKTWGY
jgi:glycosyltransferase involved in cell wall biosynthesis